MNPLFPLVIVHDASRTKQQLETARKSLKRLSYDQLEKLMHDTSEFNKGVNEARPWLDIISDEMILRGDIVTRLKEFYDSYVEAKHAAQLWIADMIKYENANRDSLVRHKKAQDALVALHGSLPDDAFDELKNYIAANNDKGCDVCWLLSDGRQHKQCDEKIKRWFAMRDKLLMQIHLKLLI